MSVIVKGGGGAAKQEKTVTAGTGIIEVFPDTGKLLSKVVVNPTPSQTKEVTAGTADVSVSPDSGKLLGGVTVHPTPSQSKTVSPSTSQQTVSPDAGKLLSHVIVKAMEDLTPEVTAQTPMISQILSNLGFTADTASGTNKQKLQTNNANLAKIEDYLPHGAYVWKKLTAQGGDFVDFVVSDSELSYPDGGTQNGYWYERFDSAVEGIDFGYVTLTSAQSSVTVAHSLGKTPRGAMITLIEGVANDSTQRTQGRSFFGNIFTNLYRNSSIFAGLYSIYNSMSEVPSNGYPFTMGTEEITFTCYVNLKFKAGKYLWIAIA